MKIRRLFFGDEFRGTKEYLKTQLKYEIARTILYFAISISLFIAGYLATKTRLNLLSVVAGLGCLPACKSFVDMLMFLRAKGCSKESSEQIEAHSNGLTCLYDMYFTAYDQNYNVAHITVKGNTICGFTEDKNFNEQAFYKHIDGILKLDNYKNTTVKIYKDIKKYTERLDQLKEVEADEGNTSGITETLKNVVL